MIIPRSPKIKIVSLVFVIERLLKLFLSKRSTIIIDALNRVVSADDNTALINPTTITGTIQLGKIAFEI